MLNVNKSGTDCSQIVLFKWTSCFAAERSKWLLLLLVLVVVDRLTCRRQCFTRFSSLSISLLSLYLSSFNERVQPCPRLLIYLSPSVIFSLSLISLSPRHDANPGSLARSLARRCPTHKFKY